MPLNHQSNHYVLNVGDAGEQNLEIQHALLYEETLKQIERAELKDGMNVWDIGCGSGHVTEMLAKKVAPNGKVYAVDISPQQIEVTSKRLQNRGIHQVVTIASSLNEIESPSYPKADCVHSRLLLMHLSDTYAAIQKMSSLLKPKGILLSQESSMDSLVNRRQHKAMNRFYELMIAYGEKYQLNYNVGSQLESIFHDSGLFDDIQVYRSKFALDTKQAFTLLMSRYEESMQKLISAGLTDPDEVVQIKKELQKIEIVSSSAESNCYTQQTHVIAYLK